MRRSISLAPVALFLVVLAACGGNPPPESGPTGEEDPFAREEAQQDTAAEQQTAEEARRDSAARADSIRRARERRREREASRLCSRARSALNAENYDRARELYQRARDEYSDTECGEEAADQLDKIDAIEVVRTRIHFEFDKSRITDAAAEKLQEKARILRNNPDLRITIEGHCDERGSNEYNMALGQRRAESAVEYLVNLGVPEEMFRTVSYGEERPLVDESNEQAWAENRRAEFVITDMGDL